MKVEFKSEGGVNGKLTLDGVPVENATMFTLVARAGDLPIAIVEAYVEMDSPVTMDAGQIVWIVRALGGLAGDVKLEVTQSVHDPDEWRVRRVHDDTPVPPPKPLDINAYIAKPI